MISDRVKNSSLKNCTTENSIPPNGRQAASNPLLLFLILLVPVISSAFFIGSYDCKPGDIKTFALKLI